jgi:hypothetical protein
MNETPGEARLLVETRDSVRYAGALRYAPPSTS